MASIFETLIAGSDLGPFLGPMQQQQAPQRQAPPRVTIGPPEGRKEREEQWVKDNTGMQAWQVFFPTARDQFAGNKPAGQMGWNWNAERERQLNAWAVNQLGG